MTMTITSKFSAGAPTEEEIERAMSGADAANSLAGYVVSEDVREIGRRFARGDITDAEAIAAVADLAKLAPVTN